MAAIKAIFFDIGDTLVFDSPPLLERLASTARSAGVALDEARLPEAFHAAEAFAVRRYVDGIVWDAPGALRETMTALLSAMEQPALTDAQWTVFGAAFASAPSTRYAHTGAAELLAELTRLGFMLGAISDWEDTLPGVLTEVGLFPYFRVLSISACVGVTKPNTGLFEAALAQAGLPPDACLHVGDWYELDVAGARAAGMNALLFDWAGRRPDADCPRVTTWEQLSEYLLA